MLDSPTLAPFLPFAHRLADAAGGVIRPYFGTALEVEAKEDASPVSRADREAEAAIRALITAEYPDHAIYGEEHGEARSDSPYTWVIDPIDGTRTFLAGSHAWGTLIALCRHGVPILGILDQPVTGERWVGIHGQPTTLNGSPIRTAPDITLANASISTTSRDYFTPPQATAFVRLAGRCGEAIAGGDCYAYGMLARGERALVADAGLKPYDILALVPIIEGAGGTITNWDYTPVTLMQYRNVLAGSDAVLHKEALAILGDWR